MALGAVRRIVVGVDGSDGARRAIGWAVAMAEVTGAPVELVHAWQRPYDVSPVGLPGRSLDRDTYEAGARKRVEAELDYAASCDGGAVVLSVVAAEGPAPRVLVSAAGTDHLVVGTRRISGVRRLVHSSVSRYAVHHARGPVTVVPPRWHTSGHGGRVVVGVDGSRESRRALRWAIEVAGRRSLPLVAVNVWHPSYPPPFSATPLGSAAEYEVASKELLEQLVPTAVIDSEWAPPFVEQKSIEGSAAASLVGLTDDDDLLVVGARGAGGVTGLLLGSVSDHCVHHARCPVTVISAP